LLFCQSAVVISKPGDARAIRKVQAVIKRPESDLGVDLLEQLGQAATISFCVSEACLLTAPHASIPEIELQPA
jgi:hypothetical protein